MPKAMPGLRSVVFIGNGVHARFPDQKFSLVCASKRSQLLENIIFEHSTAIGIRRYQADRHKLRREATLVDTEFGPVRGKVIELPSGQSRFTIEDDDARTIALAKQTTASEIRLAASVAYAKTAKASVAN